jgi:transposase
MRAEVLGVERRRRWTRDAKARLVAESLAPGACISEIARRNGIVPSLLFTWRRRARVRVPEPVFLPVQVTEASSVVPVAVPVKRRRRKTAGTIEIDLGSGRSLKVGADVDAAALARVLDVLERR